MNPGTGSDNKETAVLEGFTRILCTHQVHLLKDADIIIRLENVRKTLLNMNKIKILNLK